MTEPGPPQTVYLSVAKSSGLAVDQRRQFADSRLDDPDVAWFVETGGLDIFLTEYRDGAPVSNAKHLLRAGPGRLVFGVGQGDGSLSRHREGASRIPT